MDKITIDDKEYELEDKDIVVSKLLSKIAEQLERLNNK